MEKSGKTKKSTIFFFIALILLAGLFISIFGILPQAAVKVGAGPVYTEVSGISETAAIILFVLILISSGIGLYFKSRRR